MAGPRLSIGFDVAGTEKLKAVGGYLKDVATSSVSAADGAEKLAAAYSATVSGAKTAEGVLKSLLSVQERSARGLGDLAAAMNKNSIYSKEFLKTSREMVAATASLGTAAASTRKNMSDMVLGQGEAAAAMQHLAKASYEKVAAMQAEAVAMQKLEGLHAKYVAALASEMIANDAGAKALMTKIAAVEKATAAEARYAAGRKALVAGSVVAEINAEKAALAQKEAVVKALAAAERKLAASSKGAFSKSNVASILAEARAAGVDEKALEKLSRQYARTAASSKGFHDFIRGASGGMGTLWLSYGQFLPMLAGFAAAAGTIKTIKLGAEFDNITRSTAFLSKNIEGSTASLAGIQKEILGLRNVAHTPLEIAKAVQEMTRAGIDADKAFSQIGGGSTLIEEMGRFASVAGVEFNDAIKLSITQAAAFGEEMNVVANVIAKTADTSVADISTMSEAFKNTTQLGSVLKISFEEVAAALGLMHDRGIQGATAGAALSTALINISSAASNDKLQGMMKEWGVSFSAFDESTGKLKQLPALFNDLAKATSHLSAEQYTTFMDTLTGKRGMKAVGTLTEDAAKALDEFGKVVKEGGGNMEQFVSQLEQASGEGGKHMSYLQQTMEEMSKSGHYQLELLQGDVERLFLQSYDNASVVEALKDLREVVTDPTTVSALSSIISLVTELISLASKAIVITVRVGGDFADSFNNTVMKAGNAAGIDMYKYFDGMAKPAEYQAKALQKQVEETSKALENLNAQVKAGNVEPNSTQAGKLAKEHEDAVAALNKYKAANEQVVAANQKAGVSNSELAHSAKEVKKSTDGASTAFLNSQKNLTQMERAAAMSKMSNVDKVMGDINSKIEQQERLLASSTGTDLEKAAAMDKFKAATMEAYGPAIAEAKRKDEQATKKSTAATHVDTTARRQASEASRAQKAALTELSAEIETYSAEIGRAAKETAQWVDYSEDIIKKTSDLSKQYETAGMNEADKLMYERNKTYEEGMDTLNRFAQVQEEAAAKVAEATAKYDEATAAVAAYKEKLASNSARGDASDDNTLRHLIENQKELGKATADAVAVQYKADDAFAKAKQSANNMSKAIYGTREAYNEMANAQANVLEKSDSFWNGMVAGAKRLSTEYHTLGKLGVTAFESITSAADDAARQMSDVLFDHLTGASDDAVEELKSQYDENMQNLQESYKQGEVTVEEFEKQRAELTKTYNEEVAAAHKSLWEDISDVAGNIFENLLKTLLQEFIAWVAKLAVIWAANKIFDTNFSFGGSGGGGGSWLESIFGGSSGGSSDYAGWGTALAGAGSAAYDWMSDDSIGSGSGSYTDNTSKNWYTDGSGNIDYSGSNAGGGSSSGGGLGNYTGVAGMAVEKGYNYATTGSMSGAAAAAPTAFQTGMAGIGAIGGAYGLYSAYQQLMNGQASVGTAVQAGTSLYSLYKSYNTLAAAYDAYVGSAATSLTAAETSAAVSSGVETGMATQAATSSISTGVAEGMASQATSTALASNISQGIATQGALYGATAAGAGSTGAAGVGAAATAAKGATTVAGTSAVGSSLGTTAAAGAVPVIGWSMAAFMAVKSLGAMRANHAMEQYTSPTLGIPIEMRDYGHDEKYDLTMNQYKKMRTLSGFADAMAEGGGERGYGESGSYGATQEDFDTYFNKFREVAVGTLDILANDFGDALASMALQLDGSTAAADRFIDAAAGYDVSLADSTQLAQLATNAANGQSGAMESLHQALLALGMSEQTAQTAMMGLIASSNMIASSANSAASAVDGMTQSVQTLSSTPLKVAVNVDVTNLQKNYGQWADSMDASGETNIAHRYSAHAAGGVFSGPTLLMSRNGYRHVVGEAGAEAILPLRNTQQVNTIDDNVAQLRKEIKELRESQPVIQNYFSIDGEQISTKIMPAVDKHVAAKANRNQLGVRTRW